MPHITYTEIYMNIWCCIYFTLEGYDSEKTTDFRRYKENNIMHTKIRSDTFLTENNIVLVVLLILDTHNTIVHMI